MPVCRKFLKAEEISVGTVLTGGELPAMVSIDSISRQVPESSVNMNP